MERLVKGDIVVISFPFSNLESSKRRPALILSRLKNEDLIVCQITSKAKHDDDSISLLNTDLRNGTLKVDSYIRPTRIFTINKSVVLYKFGRIKKEKFNEAIDKIIEILRG